MSRKDMGGGHKKWTEAERTEMRELYYKRRWNVKGIANHFGVSVAAIYSQLEKKVSDRRKGYGEKR